MGCDAVQKGDTDHDKRHLCRCIGRASLGHVCMPGEVAERMDVPTTELLHLPDTPSEPVEMRVRQALNKAGKQAVSPEVPGRV